MLNILRFIRKHSRRADRRGATGSTLMVDLMMALVIGALFAPMFIRFFMQVIDFRATSERANDAAAESIRIEAELSDFAREVVNVPVCISPEDAFVYDECLQFDERPRAVIPVWHTNLPVFAAEVLGCFTARSNVAGTAFGASVGVVMRCLIWEPPSLTPDQITQGNRWRGADDPPAAEDPTGVLQSVTFPLDGGSLLNPGFLVPPMSQWHNEDDIRRVLFTEVADVALVMFDGQGPVDHSVLEFSVACLPILDSSAAIPGICSAGNAFGYGRGEFQQDYLGDHAIRRAALIICPPISADLDGNNIGDCLDALNDLRAAGYANAVNSEIFGYQYLQHRYDLLF